jgi:O-acetyl-ADP-ribose deacetylase
MEETSGNRIDIVPGDITKLEVEAIVNAANTSLLGGGGVDGAIHRAAGPRLLEECRCLGGCRPGEAKITRGYNLPARFVIHTVGPVWSGGNCGEAEILANCYRNSLQLAAENEIETIAFPAISCGAYGYPIGQAARIALQSARDFLDATDKIEKVIFALATDEAVSAYRQLL